MRQIEPAVIDDAMLRAAVRAQGPQGEAGQIVAKEGIPYGKVKHLRLDSASILKIENLWQFVSLTKLQMDSNMIEKITGLHMLHNLKWLDLSFNRYILSQDFKKSTFCFSISVIEGLENLTQLRDLSLSHNRIERIEGLDNQKQLQTLSIAHNQLNVKEDVFSLRPYYFPALRSVALRLGFKV